MKRKPRTLLYLILFLSLPLKVFSQPLIASIDFGQTTDRSIENDFTKDFKVTVTNFTAASKLNINFADGGLTSIATTDLHGASYDAGSETLTLTFHILAAEVFLEGADKHASGEIILSKPVAAEQVKLLTIKKIVVRAPSFITVKESAKKPTGYALLDAIAIINADSVSDLAAVLSGYFTNMPGGTDLKSELKKFLQDQDNRFLKDTAMLALIEKKEEKNRVVGAGLLKTSQQLLSAAGGLDVTNIADGFAKFIIKRSKAELNAAFFEKFKKEISNPRYRDLRTVFRQTFRTLNAIGDDIYLYEAYLLSLREAFEKDLASLLTNLPGIVDNHPELFLRMPELKAMMLSAFFVGQQIQNKQHPGEIIENYPIGFVESFKNVKASFQTLKLLSSSLRQGNEDEDYWVANTTLKSLFEKDDLTLKIYLGLLQQKSDTIIFYEPNLKETKLSKVIDYSYNDLEQTLPQYRTYFRQLSFMTQNIQSKIKALKSIDQDSVLFENIYDIVKNSLDVMKYFVEVENLPRFPSGLHLQDSTEKYFEALEITADLAIDINRRNYSSAIVNATAIYDFGIKEFNVRRKRRTRILTEELDSRAFLHQKQNEKLKYYRAATKAMTSGASNDLAQLIAGTEQVLKTQKIKADIDIPEAVSIANSILKRDGNLYNTLIADSIAGKVLTDKAKSALRAFVRSHTDTLSSDVYRKLLKYGSFMSALVQAKSSAQVHAAIEAIALPVGSARVKRVSFFNVSLNTYLGLHWGDEYLNSDNSGQVKPGWSSIYGVSAPIGFAASMSISRKAGSMSLFASMVDLGAIASFRLKDDETDQLPTIKLENIFAPGLYLIYGIPKTPISVGYGWQKGPQLRSVNVPDPQDPGKFVNEYVNGYRWSLFLAVDIPMFNFYTASR